MMEWIYIVFVVFMSGITIRSGVEEKFFNFIVEAMLMLILFVVGTMMFPELFSSI